MKTSLSLFSLLALAAAASGQRAPHEKLPVRVLVTGVPGSERLADFERFLGNEFTKVGSTSYSDFTPKDAEGYDVVIFDAERTPTPGRIGLPKAPTLPKDFDRASILVAGGGAILARPLGIKTNWG